jgi:hypothetical protein
VLYETFIRVVPAEKLEGFLSCRDFCFHNGEYIGSSISTQESGNDGVPVSTAGRIYSNDPLDEKKEQKMYSIRQVMYEGVCCVFHCHSITYFKSTSNAMER